MDWLFVVYDLTSEGFKKTSDIVNNEEVSRLNNKRLNKVIAGALFVSVLLLISISFWAGSRWNESSIIIDSKKLLFYHLSKTLRETKIILKMG